MRNCDKCWNRDICKYADQAKAFEDELDIWMGSEETYAPEPIHVMIRCDNFKQDWKKKEKKE